MRAAGAEGRRTHREFNRHHSGRQFGLPGGVNGFQAQEGGELSGDDFHRVFPGQRGAPVKLAVDIVGEVVTSGEHDELAFQHGFEFFKADDPGQPTGELACQPFREGEGRADGQQAQCRHLHPGLPGELRQTQQGFVQIAVVIAAAHHANRRFALAPGGEDIEFTVGKLVGNLLQALDDFQMSLIAALGEDHERRVFHKAGDRVARSRQDLGQVDHRAAVVDARGGAHDDRRAVALGEFKGGRNHCRRLFRGNRVEHWQMGKLRELAGILFGLRGDGAGIVGNDQHQPALGPDINKAHQGIRGDIEPHLLHRYQRAHSGVGRANRQLQRYFLIDRPFHMHIAGVVADDGFDDFGRGGAGVAAGQIDAGMQSGQGNRFIAHQQLR